jgi:hypothetical protein
LLRQLHFQLFQASFKKKAYRPQNVGDYSAIDKGHEDTDQIPKAFGDGSCPEKQESGQAYDHRRTGSSRQNLPEPLLFSLSHIPASFLHIYIAAGAK